MRSSRRRSSASHHRAVATPAPPRRPAAFPGGPGGVRTEPRPRGPEPPVKHPEPLRPDALHDAVHRAPVLRRVCGRSGGGETLHGSAVGGARGQWGRRGVWWGRRRAGWAGGGTGALAHQSSLHDVRGRGADRGDEPARRRGADVERRALPTRERPCGGLIAERKHAPSAPAPRGPTPRAKP